MCKLGCSVLTTRPTRRRSQSRHFHCSQRTLTPESTAATTLPVLQSQQRSLCACCYARPYCHVSIHAQRALRIRPAGRPGKSLLKLSVPGSPRIAYLLRPPHLSMRVDACRCVSMRVDAASRCPPSASILVALCRSSQPWLAYSCSSLQLHSIQLQHLATGADSCSSEELFRATNRQGRRTLLRGASFARFFSGYRGLL
jgi:hypothetical protein